MRQADGRAIHEESAGSQAGQRSVEMNGELLKDTIAALFHHSERQSVPGIIVSPGVAGWKFAAATPVYKALTGTRPKGVRQTAQEFQNCGLERSQGLHSLEDKQPQDNGDGVDPIVLISKRGQQLEEGSG